MWAQSDVTESGLVIHIIVSLWVCRDNGLVAPTSAPTNEPRVEMPTSHHRGAACGGRWIRFVPGGPWHDGVVCEAVSLILPSGVG